MSTMITDETIHQVAESDLKVALNAIQSELIETSDSGSLGSSSQAELLAKCAASFDEQIRSLVHPVSDEEYDLICEVRKTSDNISMVGGDDRDNDVLLLDEIELIDVEAQQRLEELRQQVRTRAASLRAFQEATIKRPTDLVEKKFKRMTNPKIDTSGVDEEELLVQHRGQVDVLKSSISRLTMLHDDTLRALPKTLQELEETVAGAEKSLGETSKFDQAMRIREPMEGEQTVEISSMPPADCLETMMS